MPSTNSLTIQTDLPKQENLQTQETPCIAELVRQQAAANPTALAVAAGSEVLPHVGKGEARGTPKRCCIAFEPRISPGKRKRMKYLSEVNSHPRHGAKELVG